MSKIKVGVVGYGTIGKRVADAVRLQKDMELIGITGHSYNFRMEVANLEKIKIFAMDGQGDFKENGIDLAGDVNDLIKACDIIVDCTPKKIGKENKEKYYLPNKVKAIFQGGEKADVAEASFVAQCNYKEALNKDYIRVVSCNTTGLSRTLHTLDKKFGIVDVTATMVRRGADPGDIHHGPINAIVPVLELPSHHGPDVRTVLPDLEIFTTALSVSSTLMHLHTLTCEMKKEVKVEDVIKLFNDTTRVRVVRNAEKVRSTAEIMELARDLGGKRGDMHEICIWEEAIGTHNKKLFYMQAIHQESDVVPENIDCIRAMMGFEDAEKSIKMTNESLGIK
jgi:glyceraldehyde-3-phosphate dehydrogenase (NAD(P))